MWAGPGVPRESGVPGFPRPNLYVSPQSPGIDRPSPPRLHPGSLETLIVLIHLCLAHEVSKRLAPISPPVLPHPSTDSGRFACPPSEPSLGGPSASFPISHLCASEGWCGRAGRRYRTGLLSPGLPAAGPACRVLGCKGLGVRGRVVCSVFNHPNSSLARDRPREGKQGRE